MAYFHRSGRNADFVRESLLSVHQYAQQIINPQVIGQFLRHHPLILGKFIQLPAAVIRRRTALLTGARRLAVFAEKILPISAKSAR